MPPDPPRDRAETVGQELDVEHVGAVTSLLDGQEVDYLVGDPGELGPSSTTMTVRPASGVMRRPRR